MFTSTFVNSNKRKVLIIALSKIKIPTERTKQQTFFRMRNSISGEDTYSL